MFLSKEKGNTYKIPLKTDSIYTEFTHLRTAKHFKYRLLKQKEKKGLRQVSI